jgi:hypothetical protein
MFPGAFALRTVFPISTVPPHTPPQMVAELPLIVLLLILLEAHQRCREFCVFSPFGAQTRAGVCDPGRNHTFYG